MTKQIIINKHRKLWLKFLANFRYFKSSQKRQTIKIFKAIWFILLWPRELLGDLINLATPLNDKKINSIHEPPKKILIIKTDQLGDVLFSTFLPPALKKQWPGALIDYLIQEKSAPILKDNPLINKTFFWSNYLLDNIPGRAKRGLLSKIKKIKSAKEANRKILKQLSQEKYDLIINARAFWPSSNRFLKKLGARLVSFDISQFSFLADDLALYELKESEEKNYYRLLQAAGVRAEIISAQEPRGAFYNFSPLDEPLNLPYLIISPVSFDPEKTWPAKKWSGLIKEIRAARPNIHIILSGLNSQKDYLAEISQELKDIAMVKIVTEISIEQLATLIKNSLAFIGLESFPAHLALAFKKPSYCLINSRLFYAAGLSKNHLVDGRSMLPDLPDLKKFDSETSSIQNITTALFENI